MEFKYRELESNVNNISSLDKIVLPRGVSSEDIQSIIKNRISRPMVASFLNNVINEDNIIQYATLLKQEFIPDTLDDNSIIQPYSYTRDENKYVYDLIIALIYEESITLAEILTILETAVNGGAGTEASLITAIDTLEKMVMLEYGLYSSTATIGETHKYKKKIYIGLNIPTLIYGEKYRYSYKDVANISAELGVLEVDATTETTLTALQRTDLTALDFYNDNTGNSLTNVTTINRVNRYSSNVEGQYLPIYSFLINAYNENGDYDKRMIRKHHAIQADGPNTFGHYYKKNASGTLEIKYFTGLETLSYYSHLNNIITNKTSYQNIGNYIRVFWKFILDRTINY